MKRLVLSLVMVCCFASLIVLSACSGASYVRTNDLQITDYAMPYTSDELYKNFKVAHKTSTEYKLLDGNIQMVNNSDELMYTRSSVGTDGSYYYVVFNYVLKKVVLEGSYGSISFDKGYFTTNSPTAIYAEDGTLLTDTDISNVKTDISSNGGQISYKTSDNAYKTVTILKKNGAYLQSSINGDVVAVEDNNTYSADVWYSYNQVPRFNYYDKDDNSLAMYKFRFLTNINDSYTINISNGNEIRDAVFPSNTVNVAYANGKLLYYTMTPVDPSQTSGYNVIFQYIAMKQSMKYLQEVFTYDLQSGKVEKLALPYAISSMCSLYNYASQCYDALQLDIIMFNNGVAYYNEDTIPTCVVTDNNGAVGYDFGSTLLDFTQAVQLQTDVLLVPEDNSNGLSRQTYFVSDKGEIGQLVGTQSDIIIDLENNQLKTVRNGKSGIINFQGTVWKDFVYDDIWLTSDYEIGLLGSKYMLLNVGDGTSPLSSIFNGNDVEFLASSMHYAVITTETGFDFYTLGNEHIVSISANDFADYVINDVTYVQYTDTNTSTYKTLLLY